MSASNSTVLQLHSVSSISDGRVLHFAVANGFPPQVYRPFLGELFAEAPTQLPAFCVLPPALLDGPREPSTFSSWQELADDLIHEADSRGWTQIVGVGHSFGAIAAVIAAAKRPELFSRLILLDPTLFSRSRFLKVEFARLLGRLGFLVKVPIVEGALRRRRRFASREEAIQELSARRLFSGWSRSALEAYVDGAFRRNENAPEVELIWSAEWEARFYQTLETRSWRWLARLPKALRVDIIRGGTSDTLLPEVLEGVRKQSARLKQNFHFHEIAAHGHLFPLSAPVETAHLLHQLLRQ